MTYPATPGFARNSATSRAAADSVRAELGTRQLEVLAAIRSRGPMTCDEIAAYLGRAQYVVRPRVTELCERGYLEDSGTTRETPAKRQATVWRLRQRVQDSPDNQVELFHSASTDRAQPALDRHADARGSKQLSDSSHTATVNPRGPETLATTSLNFGMTR